MHKIAAVNRNTNAATISRDSAAISQVQISHPNRRNRQCIVQGDNSLVPCMPTHGSLGTRLMEYVIRSTIFLEQSPGNVPSQVRTFRCYRQSTCTTGVNSEEIHRMVVFSKRSGSAFVFQALPQNCMSLIMRSCSFEGFAFAVMFS